jgi:hypothetical protein
MRLYKDPKFGIGEGVEHHKHVGRVLIKGYASGQHYHKEFEISFNPAYNLWIMWGSLAIRRTETGCKYHFWTTDLDELIPAAREYFADFSACPEHTITFFAILDDLQHNKRKYLNRKDRLEIF